MEPMVIVIALTAFCTHSLFFAFGVRAGVNLCADEIDKVTKLLDAKRKVDDLYGR